MSLLRRIVDASRGAAEQVENQWFDRSRGVDTAAHLSLRKMGVADEVLRDSEAYVPARPVNIRRAILAAGIQEYAGYTFVDLGSGKGRALFVAAEFPFREVVGVEFSEVVHQQALANIGRLKARYKRGPAIRSMHGNAMEFDFPDEDLVLYFFNPFGPETMQHILDNLVDSLKQHPRQAILILLWPRCGYLVEQLPGAHLLSATRRHQVFALRSE
jgi:SAM-dependent methyltransferase